MRQIGDAVRVERDVRMRVVHDADGLVGRVGHGAGREVVGQAEGMAGFVRGELAQALEDHRQHGVIGWRIVRTHP